MVSAIILGAGMGVAIAAPVGPIAALCIERTFARGARSGIATAIGAGVADAAFGVIAALGIGLVTDWVLQHARHLRVLSAIILTALAISAWRRRKSLIISKDGGGAVALAAAFTSGFLLAASSPVTIVTFAVALATFGGDVIGTRDRAWVPLGVLAGSAGWYAGLTCAAWIARERLGARALAHVGTASAIFLAGCALFSAVLAITSKT
jgi:threonine/homoserine/homoserine lactone efflux protein